MGSAKRGVLAVLGIIAGFFSLVFVSQMFRYMTPAFAGDPMSLGMWGVYVVLTYIGVTVTIVSFLPRATTGKYLGGAGGAVTAVLVLIALYLFTVDATSAIMLLMITAGQAAVAGLVYGVSASRVDESGSAATEPAREPVEPDPENTPEPEPEPEPEPAPDTSNSPVDTGTGRDIDWRTGGQIFAGVAVFLIGIPITVASPVGVPILVLGLALIPRVRSWSMQKLGRSSTVD